MAERFRSYMGPGDKDLPRSNEVQGYQPVSRIGEVVMNSFIDAYEHQVLKKVNDADDEVPAFHEWATVQPGMICLVSSALRTVAPFCYALTRIPPFLRCRHARSARRSIASSMQPRPRCPSSAAPRASRRTTSPTSSSPACAARRQSGDPVRCSPAQQQQFLPLSSSHRFSSPRADDGIGPSVDEFFTLSLGGMVTVRARLRNSAFANSVTARLSPSRSPRTAAEHVERLDLRRRSRRVDALVQRRDEVAREARAPRPPTNCSYCVSICAPCSAPRPRRSPSPPLTISGNPDRDRLVRCFRLKRKNVRAIA